MPAIVIVGAQWGDEGKGKATDLLGSEIDYVVKFNGGNNAGHTVVVGREKYVLHSIPSGILHENCRCVIGCGVVLDPKSVIDEMEALWAPIAERDDWSEFHRVLGEIDEMREAYGSDVTGASMAKSSARSDASS